MTKILTPNQKITLIEPEPEPTIDNKLELIKHLSQVQSRIKEDITSDYVYAKLEEKDKKFIIESVSNAYYGRKLIRTIANTTTHWNWNNEKQQWEKTYYNPTQQKILEQYSKNIFDSFTTRPTMLANLNRNVKDNWLIKYSVGAAQEEELPEETEEKKGITNAIKKLLKKEPPKNQNRGE